MNPSRIPALKGRHKLPIVSPYAAGWVRFIAKLLAVRYCPDDDQQEQKQCKFHDCHSEGTQTQRTSAMLSPGYEREGEAARNTENE